MVGALIFMALIYFLGVYSGIKFTKTALKKKLGDTYNDVINPDHCNTPSN